MEGQREIDLESCEMGKQGSKMEYGAAALDARDTAALDAREEGRRRWTRESSRRSVKGDWRRSAQGRRMTMG
jgi:hypothetical protein